MIYKLDDVCDFINGGAWSDKEYVSKGLPVLKVTNCKPNGFSVEDINYLPLLSATKYAKNKLQIGDVVIATVGSHPNLVNSAAGRSCIINSLVEGFYLNQNAVCMRTKDNDIVDQGYLGYHAKYRIFQHFIQMRGRGAANQMRIAISSIKSYEFNFPDIDVQRKIASILSVYDNLIENNQKQIKLLEEAAQRLYKEWFVDFRFPGYEDVKIVDGVPEGWSVTTIDSFVELQSGYAFKSSTFDDEGDYKIVTIKNVQDGIFDGDNVNRIIDIPAKMPTH
jgi:type I restriction enzyme S subunit